LKISFLQPAEQELGVAIEFYNGQEPGLGDTLFEEVWSTIERIEQYPTAWQLVSPRTRPLPDLPFPIRLHLSDLRNKR
jgi:hypothetical protein